RSRDPAKAPRGRERRKAPARRFSKDAGRSGLVGLHGALQRWRPKAGALGKACQRGRGRRQGLMAMPGPARHTKHLSGGEKGRLGAARWSETRPRGARRYEGRGGGGIEKGFLERPHPLRLTASQGCTSASTRSNLQGRFSIQRR
ncbi:unnamed protein product, partial [Prorocentrum cordatum]